MRILPLLLAFAISAQPAAAQPRQLTLSPANTQIAFSIGALGMFALAGQFTRFTGDLATDVAHLSASHVAVLVDTTSVKAEGGGSDTARQLDLLRTRDFPSMTFRSVVVSVGADGGLVMDGELTLAGVTRPLRLVARQEPGRIVASGVVERSAHGLTGLRPILSDRVALSITVQLPG